MSESFQTIGIYVPPSVVDVIDSFLYEKAGVVDVREYYGQKAGNVADGDPFAECMSPVFEEIVDSFDSLYSSANFETAIETGADELELVTVAANAGVFYSFRDKVEAARVLQECDTRSVHTAIFVSAVDAGVFSSE